MIFIIPDSYAMVEERKGKEEVRRCAVARHEMCVLDRKEVTGTCYVSGG
jgi:hypothetical protein